MSDRTSTGSSLFSKSISTLKGNENQKDHLNKQHHYNTRLSQKLSESQSLPNKELVVDLSSSKIEAPLYDKLYLFEKNSIFTTFTYEEYSNEEEFPEIKFNDINRSTRLFYNLDDSREFSSDSEISIDERFSLETVTKKDFQHFILDQNRSNNRMDMDFERPCARRTQGGGWWKHNSMYIITVGYAKKYTFSQIENPGKTQEKVRDLTNENMDIYSRIGKLDQSRHEIKNSEVNLRTSMYNMIEEEIGKLYADKTKRTDFALESAGGRIVQLSPGTENFGIKSSVFGVSICESLHGPRAMIQMGMAPGECWAIKGSHGGAVLKLIGSVYIDAVSLEHISKDISPSGDSSTAPKDFAVWGLTSPTDKGQLLGQFVYKIPGSLVQTFELPIQLERTFDFVEFKVLSNNGHPEFTCVYRLEVTIAMTVTPEKFFSPAVIKETNVELILGTKVRTFDRGSESMENLIYHPKS